MVVCRAGLSSSFAVFPILIPYIDYTSYYHTIFHISTTGSIDIIVHDLSRSVCWIRTVHTIDTTP